jgi:adenylate cyclase
MARKEEIERKLLVHPELLPELPPGARLVQGYLSFRPAVRVRTEETPGAAPNAYLTIKGEGLVGRDEFEYSIPFEEGQALLKLAHGFLVSKTRYRLPVSGSPDLTWELDVFDGQNEGLVVAEIEIPAAGHPFERPEWVGADVTEDAAYKNACLAQRPFNQWPSGGRGGAPR